MKFVVVDSSVIVKWLSKDHELNLDQADRLLKDAEKDKISLISPELAKYEVSNVLLLSKKLPPEYGEITLSQLYILPISFISESENLAKETYSIASNLGITYYDASFLSLAKTFDATLVTENLKHQGRSKDIKVKPLSEY